MLKSTIERSAGASPWRRLGKIKLGIKVKTERGEYPKDLDYFVVPDKYKPMLGVEPKELSIILAHQGLEENYTTKAAMYQSNGSRACFTLDEVTAQRWLPVADGAKQRQWTPISCPGVNCEFRCSKKCQARGYFTFMLPATREIGTFVMIFGSTVAQDRIYAALKSVDMLTQARPKGMAGIRMKLRREPVEFYKDLKGDGVQAKIVKYIPSLELDFTSLLPQDHNLLAPFFGQPLVALPAGPQVWDGADLHVEADDEKDPADGEEIPFGEPAPARSEGGKS